MRRALLLTVFLVFGAPQASLAGTASLGTITTDSKYQQDEPAVFFIAGPGERNQIVVSRGTSGAMVLQDAGAPLVAATGCSAIDARTVSCSANAVFVDAGDGDDEVTLPADSDGRRGYVRGGDGADILTGGGFLSGGAGNDVVSCPGACRNSVFAGGSGNDVLRGGSGEDVLSGDGDGPPMPIGYTTILTEGGSAGNDSIDGGAGRDQLTYRGRRTGLKVDLAAGTATGAGSAGDRDRFTGIEDVAGGDGADFLLGDGGGNRLEGDSGDDRIGGRAGNDTLFGNLEPNVNEYSEGYTPPDPGADSLSGGAGDDTLDAGSERGDALSGGPGADVLRDGLAGPPQTRAHQVDCGGGQDRIEFAPQGQLLSGCELLAIGLDYASIQLRPLRRADGRLRFAWSCLDRAGCALALGVRVGSSPLARRNVKIRGRAQRSFLVTPRRAARRGTVVEVQAIVSFAYGGLRGARWRVRQ